MSWRVASALVLVAGTALIDWALDLPFWKSVAFLLGVICLMTGHAMFLGCSWLEREEAA